MNSAASVTQLAHKCILEHFSLLVGTLVRTKVRYDTEDSDCKRGDKFTSVVSCPDPTQLTREEGVWCHKSKSLGQRKYRSLVIVSVGLQICQCE